MIEIKCPFCNQKLEPIGTSGCSVWRGTMCFAMANAVK